MPDSRRNRACAFAIVVLTAYVWWPGLRGFWGRDDFLQLAYVRLLGTPWPLFVQDHYPAPASVFRPLGFASLWLCERLFGTNYRAHALFDLALHVGVALALWRVLLRGRIAPWLACLCTLAFALHPAALGTSLWWSARFDLLATLFILLALDAACAYRDDPRPRPLIAALGAALAAMLSKEIGLIAVVVTALVWLHWVWREPAQRRRAVLATALAWSVAALYLLWRWRVLGNAASDVTVMVPLDEAIMRGLINWLHQAIGYLTFWSRYRPMQTITLQAALLISVAALYLYAKARSRSAMLRASMDLALCGLCLLLLPAVLQAPVAAFAAPLRADVSAVETAMQSRLYYLGIAGTVMLLAALANRLWQSDVAARNACALALLCIVFAFAGASHDSARGFAKRSVEISNVARAATAAVQTQQLPPAPCHVVFLGVEPAPEWTIYVSMDSIVKALSPDLDRVEHCWFHGNDGISLHLQAAPASPADALPYLPQQNDGTIIPWRRIGDAVIAYVRAPEHIDADALARIKFLRWRDGHFEDVSADVAAGRIEVKLR